MKRELTCICCPLGCSITVCSENGKDLNITGNTCKRGAEYAFSECTNPVRVVTTTVMSDREIPVPVKTDKAIPKDKIFECMDIANKIKVTLPVKIGDIAAENVCGSNLVVTAEIK